MWKIIAPIFTLTACASWQETAPAPPKAAENVCLGAAVTYGDPHISERERGAILMVMRENDCFEGPLDFG